MTIAKLDNYALARTGRWKDPRSAEGYLHTAVSSEAKMADVLPTPTRAKSRAEVDKSFNSKIVSNTFTRKRS